MAIELTAVPYLNHGRWVADCPRPYCTNAEAFGNVAGFPGGLRSDHFECRATLDFGNGPVPIGGCGLRCGVDWPPNIADIEALVLARPALITRNWRPGESLADLMRENVEHGLIPLDKLEIYGDRITAGALTSWGARPQIEG